MADSEGLPKEPSQLSRPSMPPADLPLVPRLFWLAGPEFDGLEDLPGIKAADVLEQLGPPPFPKTGFPFIGFLATIYDHVATHADRRNQP